MDSTRFDHLSRMFATRHGRRATLAGLGGLVGGLLSRAAELEEAEARPTVCRPRGSRCFPSRGLDCCEGATCRNGRCRVEKRKRPTKCKPTRNRCCRHANCPTNQICSKHRCQCRPGQKRCQDRCIAKNQCCGDCADGQVCRNGTCGVARCGHGTPCRVFVSNFVGTGNMGGLDGADQYCQGEADGTPRLHGGTFRAWLSTSDESPVSRFNHVPGSGPFVMLTGAANDIVPVAIANTWSALISGGDLLTDLNIKSDGLSTASVPASNTTPLGTPAGGPDCNGWTSGDNADSGLVGSTTTASPGWTWTENDTRTCNTNQRLFCFEQR